jgi:hypothetical protein
LTDLEEEESVVSRKSRSSRRTSTDLEQETGAIDLEFPGVELPYEESSRVSDVELARGDLYGSRSSLLSKRMSGFSLGSRFEEDELPAFGEQEVVGIEAPKISFGGESMIEADRGPEFGGFDAFDNVLDESSQRTSDVSAVREEKKSVDQEHSRRRSDQDRASFRLSLLMGEGEEEEGFSIQSLTKV